MPFSQLLVASAVLWLIGCVLTVFSHCLPSVHLFLWEFPFFIRTQLFWIRTHFNDLILTESCAKKVHSQVLMIRTSTFFCEEGDRIPSIISDIVHNPVFLEKCPLILGNPAEICAKGRELRIVAVTQVKGRVLEHRIAFLLWVMENAGDNIISPEK